MSKQVFSETKHSRGLINDKGKLQCNGDYLDIKGAFIINRPTHRGSQIVVKLNFCYMVMLYISGTKRL